MGRDLSDPRYRFGRVGHGTRGRGTVGYRGQYRNQVAVDSGLEGKRSNLPNNLTFQRTETRWERLGWRYDRTSIGKFGVQEERAMGKTDRRNPMLNRNTCFVGPGRVR